MSHEALRAGAEFDAIRSMIAQWGSVAQGIGDDAALLAVPRGDVLVTSVDACIEGRHFHEGWLSPREIGYRAAAAALSDLAAMAARPMAVLLALVVPERWDPHLTEIARGAGDAVSAAAAHIVGGNLARGEVLSVTTTVLGSVGQGGALRRDGAREGDRVYVTGRLGACGKALERLLAGGAPSAEHRGRFAHPVPRLAEARWLASRGATAATDISDGLRADAANIEAASGVALVLDATRVPVFDGATVEGAMVSGEEYELLVASSELDCAEFERRFGLPLTEIGVVRGAAQRAQAPASRGFDHFSS